MTYYDHSCGRGEGTLLQSTSASRAEPSSLRHAPTATFAQKHATPQLYFGCRRAHRSLQDYLQCHTEGLRTWATLLLQIGSLAVLVAGWAFAGMTLFIQDNASRWLLLVLLAVAIISIIGGDRLFPDETRRDGDAGMMGDGMDGSDPLQEIGMERCLDELLEQEAAQRAQELAVQ